MPKHDFELPQALRINDCIELKSILNELIHDELELTLSGAQVESIDAAGAQLLLALQLEVERRNGTVVWKQPSNALMIASTTLGFPRLSGA